MTLTEAENMQSWIYHMSVEEFASWLEGLRKDAYDDGFKDGINYDQ